MLIMIVINFSFLKMNFETCALKDITIVQVNCNSCKWLGLTKANFAFARNWVKDVFAMKSIDASPE